MSVISTQGPWGGEESLGQGNEPALKASPPRGPWVLRTAGGLGSPGSQSLGCISKSLVTIPVSSNSRDLEWDVGSEVSQWGRGVELLDPTHQAHLRTAAAAGCHQGSQRPGSSKAGAAKGKSCTWGMGLEALEMGVGLLSLVFPLTWAGSPCGLEKMWYGDRMQ